MGCLISLPIGKSRGSETSDLPVIDGALDLSLSLFEITESFALVIERESPTEASLALRPSLRMLSGVLPSICPVIPD